MSLNKYLESSWNFDTVTGSDGSGAFLVDDTSNENYGKATGLTANTSSMVLKEELKTGRKQHYETLEGLDTIQLVDTDDERLSGLEKPSSVKLMVENSMYQIVSDEMLNLFASVDDYAFRFSIPDNKYKSEYEQLLEARALFFEKVLEKPNLEKYIEFYKWIDSSLGDLIDQLKPENSSEFSGLKTTVESHILERSKYQHILPVTVGENKIYTNPDRSITVVRNTSANAVVDGNTSGPYKQPFLQGGIAEVAKIENNNTNFKNNYEVFQGAGKYQNNRTGKTNKSIIQTKFSSGDGLSENNRYADGEEFSVYNEINQRATNQKNVFNTSQSIGLGTQGQNTTASSTTINNFRDNNFIQRSIPYTSSNYHEVGVLHYEQIPGLETEFRQRNNILIDAVETGLVVIEPPVEFTVPAKHTLKVKNAFEDIEVYSPYNSKIDTFSPRTLQETGTLEQGFTAYFDRDIGYVSDEDTFFRKIENLPTGQVEVKRVEILDNIFPRKDLMGRAETRTKPNYEEIEGVFSTSSLTWSPNSYNNNSAQIRSFWKDDISARRRTRGFDNSLGNYSGSINSLNQINKKQATTTLIRDSSVSLYTASVGGDTYVFTASITNHNNSYDSVCSMERSVRESSSINAGALNINFGINNNGQQTIYGDLSPYGNDELIKFTLKPAITNDYIPKAKPSFIFHAHSTPAVFYGVFFYIINQSYSSTGSDIIPFYDSYKNYFENIKSFSQNYSILPEFMVSNFKNIFKNKNTQLNLKNNFFINTPRIIKNIFKPSDDIYLGENYLKILGRENFDEINENNFVIDFNKFFNNKSNKIKLNISGVKKLLPYKGFYPAEKCVDIVNNFYTSYVSGALTDPSQIQTLIQPFFAPGILFNTIKSGLAVDYPVCLSNSNSYDSSSVYLDESYDRKTIKTLNYRIPFEAILSPKQLLFDKKSANNMYYLDPDRYTSFFNGQASLSRIQYPYVPFNSFSASTEAVYKYSINNFLAEIPNFFLNNKQLTYFISEPESAFSFKKQTTYKLKIKIQKNTNFSMFKTVIDDNLNLSGYETSFFGPPVSSDASYDQTAPYVPPYFNDFPPNDLNSLFYNEIVVSFTTDDTERTYKVSDIFASASILSSSLDAGSYARNNAMFLNSCLNILTQKINSKQVNFNTITGEPLQNLNTPDYRWVIQTKMETPLIDFSDYQQTLSIQPEAINIKLNSNNTTLPAVLFPINTDGIWSSLGEIPKDGESIQISIYDDGFENSLLRAVGFKKETKSIGSLANNKKISEAVVILPFFKTLENVSNDKFTKNIKENLNLIKIPESTINTLLGVPNYKTVDSENSRRIDKIKTILNTNPALDKTNTIIDMMIKMVNYNIPPHLNWIYDTTLEPVAIFITEFDHNLSKQDLANIWQNTMPEIAEIPEVQTKTIEYFINENELLGNIDLLKTNISAKIFKIKYRANTSYLDMLDDIEDNNNYKYQKVDQSIPWHSYNWPYDYFSLVELVNIQAGEVYEATGSV